MKELLQSDLLYHLFIISIAAFVSFIAIPSIIFVANTRKLYDDLETDRKEHKHGISRLGGVAIFCSFTIISLLFAKYDDVLSTNVLLSACIMLFAVGLKDDLAGASPRTKFSIQFLVASILVIFGDIRLTSLYGVFNVWDIGYFPSILLTAVLIMFIINAFNLIDGIDGLAGTIGVLVCLTFGIIFLHMNQSELSTLAFSMVGALMGFLYYNYTPARIFMGDTGSLLIGLIAAVLGIKFIELNKIGVSDIVVSFVSAPAIAVAILIIPVFDTLRVFTIRILKGKSPFSADRNHIHHRILSLGFNHGQTTLALVITNIFFIYLSMVLNQWGNFNLILLFFSICLLINWATTVLLRVKKRKTFSLSFLVK